MVRSLVAVVFVLVCTALSGQDVIEREYFKNATARNAAIAAARYAEEGFYYNKFSHTAQDLNRARAFADTALFFMGRSLMLSDTALKYVGSGEVTGRSLLTKGRSYVNESYKLLKSYYGASETKTYRIYGINTGLYLSNAVMDLFNASLVMDGDDGQDDTEVYATLPYAEEITRLQADESSYMLLGATYEEKIRECDDLLSNLEREMAGTTEPAIREKLMRSLAAVQNERTEVVARLNDTAGRIENIQELLDGKYMAELRKLMPNAPAGAQGIAVGSSGGNVTLDGADPDGLAYKIQLGYYSGDVDNSAFYGLQPITGQTVSSSTVVYYAGIFNSYLEASKGMQYIRSNRIENAFIVPFYNGERINTRQAVQIERTGTKE